MKNNMKNKTQIYFAIFLITMFVFSCKEKAEVQEYLGTDGGMVEDTSQNALDWDGVYAGTLPCADCDGIETSIELNNDNTYNIREVYVGKSDGVVEEHGNFTWHEHGTKIVLVNTQDSRFNRIFLVGENLLYALDEQGKMIEGEQADSYVLHKK